MIEEPWDISGSNGEEVPRQTGSVLPVDPVLTVALPQELDPTSGAMGEASTILPQSSVLEAILQVPAEGFTAGGVGVETKTASMDVAPPDRSTQPTSHLATPTEDSTRGLPRMLMRHLRCSARRGPHF